MPVRGWWNLAENLSLRFEPIVERIPMLIASFTIALISPGFDQGMQVIAWRQR